MNEKPPKYLKINYRSYYLIVKYNRTEYCHIYRVIYTSKKGVWYIGERYNMSINFFDKEMEENNILTEDEVMLELL